MAEKPLYTEILVEKLNQPVVTDRWPNQEVRQGETLLGTASEKIVRLFELARAAELKQEELCATFHDIPANDSAEYQAAELEHDTNQNEVAHLNAVLLREIHFAFPDAIKFGAIGFRKDHQLVGAKTPDQIIKESVMGFVKDLGSTLRKHIDHNC